MRRSAAPSQIAASKRFKPPLRTNSVPNIAKDEAIRNRKSAHPDSALKCEKKENVNPLEPKKLKLHTAVRKFVAPVSCNVAKKGVESSYTSTVNLDEDPMKCFSVVYCKRSNKKHKKWEGDGILTVKGKTCVLKSNEGKNLSQTTSYSLNELKTLKSGEGLFIGGKEIEIMNPLKIEDYNSGKCFLGTSAAPKAVYSGVKSSCPKKMSQVFKNGQIPSAAPNKAPPKARHAVDSPNALVFPRPPEGHRKVFNAAKKDIVDVVLDPYLAVHMRPHQREGVLFLYSCVMGYRNVSQQGAVLADHMGLGKTLQCIALLWTLLKQSPYHGSPVIRRAVIVCPSSLVKNWGKEIKKWLGDERLKTFLIGDENKPKDFKHASIFPVMIISYEMFRKYLADIKKMNVDLIICDEAHRVKNSGVKITQALMSMACKRRVLVTGTPIQNDLGEFFALCDFCNPGALGSYSSFKKVFEEPIIFSKQPNCSEEDKNIGKCRSEELSNLTQSFILRRTQEVNYKYLPPKTETVVFCQLTPFQKKLYESLLSSPVLRACFDSGTRGSSHLTCITALKKVCNTPDLIYEESMNANSSEDSTPSLFSSCREVFLKEEMFEKGAIDKYWSGKFEVLARILENNEQNADSNEKVVIVSHFTQTLDCIEKFCTSKNLSFLRLDGSTPLQKRQQLVDTFNSKHSLYSVFLLSSKAGGVGLNLVGASILILYDIDWNPANDQQSMARVWRDGQTRHVQIYRLLSTGTIEEKIYQRQITKQALKDVVADGICDESKFSKDELRRIFSLKEATNSDTHDLLKCKKCEEVSVEQHHQGKSAASSTLQIDELLHSEHVNPACNPEKVSDRLLMSLKEKYEPITFLLRESMNEKGSDQSS
eukprot:Nk52_evm54s270 gene=Nk52_evmTU54s270